MNTLIKVALAALLTALLTALLLAHPIGACAASPKMPGAPADPCCPGKRTPAPAQDDCSKPGCVCMDTRTVPMVAPPAGQTSPLDAALVTSQGSPTGLTATLAPPALRLVQFVSRHLFLTLHQFLI